MYVCVNSCGGRGLKLSRRTQGEKVRVGPVEGGRGPGPAKTAWGQALGRLPSEPLLAGEGLAHPNFRLTPRPWGRCRVGACGGDRGCGACQDPLGDKPLVGYPNPS